MRILAILGAATLALCLAGCTASDLVGDVTTATGLTVTRHEAIVVGESIATLQDADTVALVACTAARHFTGVCSDAIQTAAHNVLVASRLAVDNLLTYADEHADLPAGPGGVYELAVDSVTDLQAAIKTLGAVPPVVPTPAAGS